MSDVISVSRSIELLLRQAKEADEIAGYSYNDPAVDAWQNMTEAIVERAFGSPNGNEHANTRAFKDADFGSMHFGMTDAEMQYNHQGRIMKQKALLLSFAEQLRLFEAPGGMAPATPYKLHPLVERCAGKLYRDGHYKQAALEAYICVIERVKEKSNLQLDGDDLMNQAFGSDRRVPILRINQLSTQADRDEQKGFMFLFKGVVGLRNFKAHTNRIFDDPSRAHEYLALCSLLLRIIELSTVV